jgi:hypothetical protein
VDDFEVEVALVCDGGFKMLSLPVISAVYVSGEMSRRSYASLPRIFAACAGVSKT